MFLVIHLKVSNIFSFPNTTFKCNQERAANGPSTRRFQQEDDREDKGSVCKVRTQDPENFDEEVKSLVTAWWNLFNRLDL